MEPYYLFSLELEKKEALAKARAVFSVWLEARRAKEGSRGSMSWALRKGQDYLVRSYYDQQGARKQQFFGPRSTETERLKLEFEDRKAEARRHFEEVDQALANAAFVISVVPFFNLPPSFAHALRAIDARPEIRDIVRVVGSAAIYAYQHEADVVYHGADPEILEVEVLAPLPQHLLLSLQRLGVIVVAGQNSRRDAWSKQDQVWLKRTKSREAFVLDEDSRPIRMLTIDPQDWLEHVSARLTDEPEKFAEEFQAAYKGEVLAPPLDTILDFDL